MSRRWKEGSFDATHSIFFGLGRSRPYVMHPACCLTCYLEGGKVVVMGRSQLRSHLRKHARLASLKSSQVQ